MKRHGFGSRVHRLESCRSAINVRQAILNDRR
ncbi:MAG: hypothetical protein AW07_00825 [Candidatus Accumulibacter sp. SK-11]|nr:MAG: hypothetical protein AW07_00825 [Candidatus Accumulibacter sp. SK-11]